MSYKILKVIFVILLLITVGEAGYYVYILNINRGGFISNNNNISQNLTVLSQVTPTPTVTDNNRLINQDILDFLATRKKNTGQKYYLTGEYDGYVGDFQEIEGEIDFTIVDKTGNVLNRLSFKPQDLDNIIYRVEDGKKSLIKLSDVKLGEKVHYEYKYDMKTKEETFKEITVSQE